MKYLALILALIIGTPTIAVADELTKTNFYYDIQWGHLIIGHISVSLERKNSSIKLNLILFDLYFLFQEYIALKIPLSFQYSFWVFSDQAFLG